MSTLRTNITTLKVLLVSHVLLAFSLGFNISYFPLCSLSLSHCASISGLVETDPEGALSGFEEVVRMEPEKAEW